MADPKALARKAATLAVSNLRAAEVGGCFNPVDDTQGECADGDCYCARQCEREADAAVTAYFDAIAPTDAAPSQTIDMCPGDGKPCYVNSDPDEAHFRCGTVQCDREANKAAPSPDLAALRERAQPILTRLRDKGYNDLTIGAANLIRDLLAAIPPARTEAATNVVLGSCTHKRKTLINPSTAGYPYVLCLDCNTELPVTEAAVPDEVRKLAEKWLQDFNHLPSHEIPAELLCSQAAALFRALLGKAGE